jgi:hypothetical protein
MGNVTSKATLAKSNEKKDYRIYESFAFILVAQPRRLSIPGISLDLTLDAPVYAAS